MEPQVVLFLSIISLSIFLFSLSFSIFPFLYDRGRFGTGGNKILHGHAASRFYLAARTVFDVVYTLLASFAFGFPGCCHPSLAHNLFKLDIVIPCDASLD
jgi:hypothetical protein